MPKFDPFIQKLRLDYERTVQEGTPDAYIRLQSILEEIIVEIREYLQKETSGQIRAIIRKLEKSQPLAAEDKDMLRHWIVGDAETYTRAENDYENWLAELKRIGSEILKLEGKEIDVPSAFHVSGLLRDSIRTLADISFFLEQKERIKRFLESTAELDAEERTTLMRVLELKLLTREF